MTSRPAPEEVALWQKRLASQANNRAWALAELHNRTPEEDEEMLQAINAAMYLTPHSIGCGVFLGTGQQTIRAARFNTKRMG